jgi:hypothetical protein
MSVNYNTPTISNRLQQVINAMDGGGSNGVLRLLNAGGTVLSSLTLARPSGTVSGNILSFSGLSLVDPAAAASGTATAARIEDSTGTTIISGLTVSNAAGADIVLTPTNAIVAGQAIAITAATIQGN